MEQKTQGLYEFGRFRLEVSERRLWRDDTEPVQLPPKVFDLLCLLLENHGKLLEKSFILQSLWPGTFVEEANLSVNISQLRRALGESSEATYIETVPKRGYRFVAEVREIPVVAPLAEQPAPLAEGTPEPHRTSPSRAIWIAAGVVAVAAMIWGVRTWITGHSAPPNSIAVLPFQPLDSTASDNRLGLGMADAVITRLSAVTQIAVRPTGAIAKFSGVSPNAQAAGRELGVDAVLEGRIQQDHNRVRVTVRLCRVSDGNTVWADKFDDYFSNIFAVQDSISEKVADALALKLTEAERTHMNKRSTESAEAYQLYLQGLYLSSKRINQATLSALEYYEKATEKDPDYALAYAALASASVLRAGEAGDEKLRDKARTAALKAIGLDPQLADAQVALGQILMRTDWDWPGAERAFSQAIKINPNLASAHAALSTLLTAFGRFDEANREMELACRLDPTSANLRSDLAWTLHIGRRYSDAVEEARKAVKLDTWSYTPRRQLSKALLMLGRYDQALQEAHKALDIAGSRNRRVLAEFGNAQALSGQVAEAKATLRDVREGNWADPEPHYEVAVLSAALHEPDRAIESLTSAVNLRLTRVIWMNVDPDLETLRHDPRFQDLLRKMRLTQ